MEPVLKQSSEQTGRIRGMDTFPLVLVALSVVCVVLGFTVTDYAVPQIAFFALAAVAAIWARIAQAQKNHERLIDAIRGDDRVR